MSKPKAAKPRMGRPPIDPRDRKERFPMRASLAQLERWRAKAGDKPLTTWLAELADKA